MWMKRQPNSTNEEKRLVLILGENTENLLISHTL
jgi:hypothetical protein